MTAGDLPGDPDAPAVTDWDVPVSVTITVRVSTPDSPSAQAAAQNIVAQQLVADGLEVTTPASAGTPTAAGGI